SSGSEAKAHQVDFAGLLKFKDGEKLMRLRVDQRQLRGAIEQLMRDGGIVLANRDDREIDHGKGLVRLPAEGDLEIFFRGVDVPVMQLKPGEVDQHPNGIAAVCDGAFEKCAWSFPVECPEADARAKKNKPHRQ